MLRRPGDNSDYCLGKSFLEKERKRFLFKDTAVTTGLILDKKK